MSLCCTCVVWNSGHSLSKYFSNGESTIKICHVRGWNHTTCPFSTATIFAYYPVTWNIRVRVVWFTRAVQMNWLTFACILARVHARSKCWKTTLYELWSLTSSRAVKSACRRNTLAKALTFEGLEEDWKCMTCCRRELMPLSWFMGLLFIATLWKYCPSSEY